MMKPGAMIAAAVMVALATSPLFAQDDVVREGAGQRRDTLNSMELKPFPTNLWNDLSDWKNGPAPTAADMDGKVVVIVTFFSLYPPSYKAMSLAERLCEQHAADGLIVIGVHHPKGWDRADEVLKSRKITFPVAHDADGKFREGLMVDQDPDFYLIDRAGNLRFADITTDSVKNATEQLLGETAEHARSLPGALAKQAAERHRDLGKTEGIKTPIKPGERVNATFELPDDAAYESADWPWRGLLVGKTEFNETSEKIEHEAPKFELPEDNWYPSRPNTKGRVVVVYLFDPKATITLGIVNEMNKLQEHYWADVDVVGGAANLGQDYANVSDEKKRREFVERNREAVLHYFKNRELNHSIMLAPPKTDQLYQGSNGIPLTRGEGIDTWAWAFIISTDGRVRYGGHPDWDSFERSLRSIINADPGVRARRMAEQVEIRRRMNGK